MEEQILTDPMVELKNTVLENALGKNINYLWNFLKK